MSEAVRLLPRIPSVERVLASEGGSRLLATYARTSVVCAIRDVLEELRARVRAGDGIDVSLFAVDAVANRAAKRLAGVSKPRVRAVVNATGVILHTNLGRALLAPQAIDAAARAASSAVALEYDLEGGERGDRDGLVEEHLCALTGAEAATVVNNNAAAVLLMLNALAEGREVVVSRGELIEIGGSFRIPDIMEKSGAILCEVGTTNRTHVHDYERAIGPQTAVLLKVHTSNYRIVGFTSAVDLPELRRIADGHEDLVVCEDLGAGALVDLAALGLPKEPVVSERVAAGADVVTFSGDKLLGGPQCGIIVGRRDLLARIRKNPLKRAVRCDKMTLAALEATLRIYRFDPVPHRTIPALWALTRPIEELDRLAKEAAELLRGALGPEFRVTVEESSAQTGSGSQPEVPIASRAVAIRADGISADELARRFRSADPPIIGRIERDTFLLDVRTVRAAEDLVPRQATASSGT